MFNRQYQLFPEAAVGHFVESLLRRKQIDPKVLDYAIRNHEWRTNSQSIYLLAKAYQKVGNQTKASDLMSDVFSSPWRSGDIELLVLELGVK